MNAESIAGWIEAIGVPADVVSIGAESDDAWCLIRDDTVLDDKGERAPEWEVFWREQGNRYDWARFTNEHVACCYLFGRLAWTQLASGVLSVARVGEEEPADASAEAPADVTAAAQPAQAAEPAKSAQPAQSADQPTEAGEPTEAAGPAEPAAAEQPAR